MSRPQRLPESVQTLTIDRLAAGGDGVARADGMAVFVPRTAPGDVAQVAYVSHARHGRGRVLQLLTPSPHRVEPACPHYVNDRCGGCQLQHLDVPAQQLARREIVQDALRRIGRRDVPLPELESGALWGYRSRLTLTLKRKGQGWIGGLHPHDDPGRVFALETCLIAHPVLVDVWSSVRSLVRSVDPGLPATQAPTDSLRLSLRLDTDATTGDAASQESPAGVQLVIEGGVAWPAQDSWRDAVMRADGRVRGVWWTPSRTAATGGRGAVHAATEMVANDYAPQAREALAFAQVNAGIAAQLRAHVFDAVQRFAPRRVIDGYAGTGALTARLAEAGVSAVAIEADPAGAEAAVARLAALGEAGRRSRVVCDLMERALASIDGAADVVLLNPPRRGVHPDVAAWLEAPAQQGVRGVVYVSCDPATLARDLSRLPSWRVAHVHCFDMFPQTAHVETVCVLQRENT